MTKIQLVIEIDEENYEKNKYGRCPVTVMRKSIRNGTPLPKGHGRLIDVNDFCENVLKDKRTTFSRHDIWMMLRPYSGIPTIIRADKEG